MDPVGPQKKISGSKHAEHFQKLLDEKLTDFGGGFNEKSGTRKTSEGRVEADFQGTVKGKTKHTYKGE